MSPRCLLALALLVSACDEPKPAPTAASATATMSATAAASASATATATASASATAAASASASGPEFPPPSEVTVQHLLVQYRGAARSTKSQSRTKEEAKKFAEELHKKALAGEDFSQLSIDHSDSPEAKDRRGSLGKIRKGDMDKTFEAAAFKLKVGEISPVVETRFGFHVIKRNQ